MMRALHVAATLRHTEAEGRAVLLDLRTEQYYALDPVATSMWRELVRTGSRDEALQALLGKFQVEPARLEADLDAQS